MKVKRLLVACAAPVLVFLVGCGSSAPATPERVEKPNSTNESTLNTDPREGPVFVKDLRAQGYYLITVKFCDGSTLVYNFTGDSKGGGAVIPDSPECS